MLDLSNIPVLAELERAGIKYEFAGDDEVKVICPFHDDSSPSCNVNVKKRQFNCRVAGCGAHGDIVGLLARYGNVSRAIALLDLAKRHTLELDKTVDAQLIETYHAAIWNAGALRQELYDRGLIDADLRKYRIGENDGRIMIPIRNASGYFVNIRKYLPGAKGADKMRNLKGCGAVRWHPIEQLKYETLVLMGGELKAVVAAERELNAAGIGAISATSGEGNITPEMLQELRGKRVFVCLDIDKAGQRAAAEHCYRLHKIAGWIGEPIALPLDPDKFPKGDYNNYYMIGGRLLPLLEACEQFTPQQKLSYTSEGEALDVELTAAVHADVTAKRLKLRGVVSSMDTSPYIVPCDIEVICGRDQKECAFCPVALEVKNNWTIPNESPVILEFINAHKLHQMESVKAAIGIPRNCRVCEFRADTYYNVEDARISPQLEITNRSADKVLQPALCIGRGLELNECYNLTGRMFPHPKTQQSTLLISGYEPTQDALSSYSPDDIETLGAFWPREWSVEGIQEKLDDIYSDFEANVTRIFQRRDLHLATDLVYHSPLLINFDGKTTKGWVEGLILGDSSQGKSDVACGSNGPGGLMLHYGLGEKVDMRNATVAGLLGGLQQQGSRWFVSWGIIPTHDKRLVILEELKGANPEVLPKLTDMRSSGIAEIPKIEKRRTHARTRLLVISNPPSEQKITQYNFGVEAVKDLIGALEDIRRFDFAVLVSGSEIDPAVLNMLQEHRPQVPHTYTGELCRKLILWAWTRTKDQVVFDGEATQLALTYATGLCEMFTDAIPLVDRGSMRLKIARLAASLAARTFSCSEDYQTLIVYPAHVQYAAEWLVRIYSSTIFGYSDFTRATEITHSLIDPELIRKRLGETPFPSDFVKSLLAKNKVDAQDLQDWTGYDREQAGELLSFLVRKHGLMRDGRFYRKTSKFIALLKNTLDTAVLVDKPPHVREY